VILLRDTNNTVGGIVRQVFSPIFAGSSVICCPSFDPGIFWSLLHNHSFTWYYAAPTMHQLILQTGRDDNYIDKKTGTCPYSLRMIANAAGGLLPSLANDMMKTFGANVSLVMLFMLTTFFDDTNQEPVIYMLVV
jgi:acyl-coenzyme A synthetase/AMP-(fatty) acid ligase